MQIHLFSDTYPPSTEMILGKGQRLLRYNKHKPPPQKKTPHNNKKILIILKVES